MPRPTQSRRSVLKTLGAATLIATTGCLTRGTDDPPDDTGNSSEIERDPAALASSVRNEIEEFEISNITVNENAFTFTVTNTGDTPDELIRYNITVTLHSVAGDEHTTAEPALPLETLNPGESTDVTITAAINPDRIRRYELTIACGDGTGAYC